MVQVRLAEIMAVLFCPLLFIACSENFLGLGPNHGTTEEQNAYIWKAGDNRIAWHISDADGFENLNYENGLGGSVALNKPSFEGVSFVSISLDVPDSISDLSKKQGLCLSYMSELNLEVALDLGDSINSLLDGDLPRVSLGRTGNAVGTRCAFWNEFRQSNSSVMSGVDAAKNLKAIQFVFSGSVGEIGAFNVQKVESIGTIESLIQIRNSAVEKEKPLIVEIVPVDTAAFVVDTNYFSVMWDGAISYQVEPQDGNVLESVGAGYWYAFNDSVVGGASKLLWPVDMSAYDVKSINPAIDYCGGVCASVLLDPVHEDPYAGVAFDLFGTIEGYDQLLSGDVTDYWAGVCVTYVSEIDMTVVLDPGPAAASAIEYDLPEAIFERSITEVSRCARWSAFRPKSLTGLTGNAAAANLATLRFKFAQASGQSFFNLRKFGVMIRKAE